MLFDPFDHKIKKILNEPHSDFEESSWKKMEQLLDKHLPQQKDRRRRFLFLLFFFLLLSSSTVLWFASRNSFRPKDFAGSVPALPAAQTDQSPNRAMARHNSVLSLPPNTSKQPASAPNTLQKPFSSSNNKFRSSSIKRGVSFNGTNFPIKKSELNTIPQPVYPNDSNVSQNNETISQLYNDEQRKNQSVAFIQKEKSLPEWKKEENISQGNLPASPILPVENDKNILYKTTETNRNLSPHKSSVLQNVFITVSLGPDLSSVGFNNAGKIKLAWGAGVGYRFTPHWSLRSGIYGTKKIYTAAPEEYNPPANFWNYYPNLKSIDANCNVMEWPVNLDYHWRETQRLSGFVSAGISSLFMKEENYNYYFKPLNSPQYIYYSRTYKNVNKHYFSVLNLSAGFIKKFGPGLSLQAEPYFKLALQGIGYGKVKLNSSGILFSVILHPFSRSSAQSKAQATGMKIQ